MEPDPHKPTRSPAPSSGGGSRGCQIERPLLGWTSGAARCDHAGLRVVPSADEAAGERPVRGRTGQHWIAIGPTGSGKTTGIVMPQILEHPGPVVVVDIKGELYRETAGHRRRMGQEVLRFDPFGLIDEPAHRLNPLDLIRLSPHPEAIARAMAETLMPISGGIRDAFWPLMGNALNAAGLHLTALAAPQEGGHHAHVSGWRATLHGGDIVYSLGALLNGRPDLPVEVREELCGFLQLPEVTRGGVLATAQAPLKVFGGPKLRTALGGSDIDLAAIRDGAPVTLYLCWPPAMLKSHAPVLRLILSTLIDAILLRQPGCGGTDTLIVIDEAGTIGEIPQVETAFVLTRDFGARVTAVFQSVNQLYTAYGAAAQTVLDNAGLISILPPGNYLAASQAATLIGRVSAEEILAMGPSEVMVAEGGFRPRRLRRPNVLTDLLFAGMRKSAGRGHGPDRNAP